MKCSYCGGIKFFEGPAGGMCINVLCANKDCRHWFNFNPLHDELEDLNRQEPSDEEKEQAKQEQAKFLRSLPQELYKQGVDLYATGESVKRCIISKPHWHQCTGEDLYKLAGWMDCLRADLLALTYKVNK